jgi:hypothetical protein
MTAENRSNRYVWVIMMVLSILLLLWTVPLLLLSGGTAILEQGLDLAGSPLVHLGANRNLVTRPEPCLCTSIEMVSPSCDCNSR